MSRRPPDRQKPPPGGLPLLEQAVILHRAGRTEEAAEIYEKIIALTPGQFDATHLLGVIALQNGSLERAQDLITSALRINPRDSAALNNLGTVYLRRREYDRAYEQFELAVRWHPEFFSALVNIGTVLRELGRSRDALPPLKKAHSADPNSVTVCNLLGACLMDTGDPHQAIRLFEAATLADPNDADGWGNLAVALNSTGDHERARACADKAVAMRPDSSAALAARAAVEFELGDIETATSTYKEAVALSEPSTQTLCAYANALWTSGRCEDAVAWLRRAVAADDGNAMARWKVAMSQCRTYYDTEAEIANSRLAFAESLSELQTWFRVGPRPEAFAAVGSTQPFFIAYQPSNNRELLSRYGDICSEWMASMPRETSGTVGEVASSTMQVAAVNRKLRIGIASAHIRDHSVWNAITKGWVHNFDKARFDILLFQLGGASDDETSRARKEAVHFDDQPKSLTEWVKAIKSAELDALIYPEIGMDALTVQLASLRLAPVQAATWGHAETTGLPTMDLYLSAEGLEPVCAQDNYRERLVRLPNLGVCVERLIPAEVDPDLKSLKLPGDEPLLLCPGTPFKYPPLYDHVWARIAKGLLGGRKRGWARIAAGLRGGGNGRLVFFRSGNHSMDALLERRLRRAFIAEQVDFDGSVCVLPYLARPRFFGLMRRATLLIDTIGFSGFNNALQAVEAGLPVLAHEGAFMRGRLASGIMRRMKLPELVASTNEDFIRTAVRLAFDPSEVDALRTKMAERREILFHDLEPVRALERCLIEAIGRTPVG